MSSFGSPASQWVERNGHGAAAPIRLAHIVASGSDFAIATTGGERLVYVHMEDGTDDYRLLDLTPVYLVASGSDYVLSTTGPAAAIYVASGSDLELSTDLTQTPAADLFYDPAGTLCAIRRSALRLSAFQLGTPTDSLLFSTI